MERTQIPFIENDLTKKMAFIIGPRQAGKTWIAKQISQNAPDAVYLNYDQITDRALIEGQSWHPTTQLLVLDELHKMPNWRNYLKGLYDTRKEGLKILVTGSARLDLLKQVGDSLAGRFFMHHLMPLSLAELKQTNQPLDLDRLIERGGFPEPYLANEPTEAKRWRLNYIDSLLRIDAFEFEKIQALKAMQLVFELLRHRVGSPISYTSIAEDAHISPNTVKRYIQIFESLYIIFRVSPFSNNIARSLQKEPKIYFFDTGLVEGGEGAKLENLVAMSLIKYVYSKIDYQGERYALHCLRTKDGKEVDFALVNGDKIESIIEVKNKNKTPVPALSYFHKKYNLPAVQIVRYLQNEYMCGSIQIRQAVKYLSELY